MTPTVAAQGVPGCPSVRRAAVICATLFGTGVGVAVAVRLGIGVGEAGRLGLMIGVLVGALLAGTVGDILGRRKVMLVAYAWFSIGMAVTALTQKRWLFIIAMVPTFFGVFMGLAGLLSWHIHPNFLTRLLS